MPLLDAQRPGPPPAGGPHRRADHRGDAAGRRLADDRGRPGHTAGQPPDGDPLFSPALELSSWSSPTPTTSSSSISGPTAKQWQRAAPGLMQRRDAILEQVRRLRTLPSGDFPCSQPWPDPAYGRTRWWDSSVDDPWGIRS
jgi:hypothetical protein